MLKLLVFPSTSAAVDITVEAAEVEVVDMVTEVEMADITDRILAEMGDMATSSEMAVTRTTAMGTSSLVVVAAAVAEATVVEEEAGDTTTATVTD